MVDVGQFSMWHDWVRAVRVDRGSSLQEVAAQFKSPAISEELLRLVEIGKRKFSPEEYARWRELFDISVEYPEFPLASSAELERRRVWRRTKPVPRGLPQWCHWVKNTRNKNSKTLKEVAGAMAIPDFIATTLSDIERGFRKFKQEEYEAWAAFFSVSEEPPYEIPFADEISEKARLAAKQSRKNKDQSEPPEARKDLAERTLKILMNPHLTLGQVEELVQKLREDALTMLGL